MVIHLAFMGNEYYCTYDSEEHYLEIESRYFKNRLNIKQVSPDLDNKDFIMIRGGYSS